MKMIDMHKSLDARKIFLLSIGLLISADVVILLDIPFLRQILGFLFLTILPGLLILQVLKLNKINYTEKFVLSVGLSISFLMFFGLLVNNLSLTLGYKTPLATTPLLISFNIAFVVLAIIGCKINKEPILSLPNIELTASEKAFLVVPSLFPTLSIFGMHVMNTTDNNILLMALLFLIPIYVAFIYLFNHKFSDRLYPVVIFLISISLLLLLSLRSNHIMGCDTHVEYYFFQTTLNTLHWGAFGHSTFDACLSISVLPTAYQSILNIPSEYLFKILYSLIYSVSPLAVYTISKKYVGESYGFLASFFFMSQGYFLNISANSRTCIAILFFALAMMILFSDKVDPLKKRILFIVFMVSCMVSHYSTTYIFFFIMLGTFLGIGILSKKYTFKKVISLTIVILFFSTIFFWYSQVTETAFGAGVSFIETTFNNLNNFFVEESRTPQFEQLGGKGLSALSKVNWVVTWCTFIYIGIGVLITLKRYKEMVSIAANVNQKKPDFLKSKFELEYLAIALMCAGLLVIIIMLPYISVGYDIWRTYSIVIIILSTYFVIGGIVLSKNLSLNLLRKVLSKTLRGKKALPKKQKEGGVGERGKEKEKASQARAYLVILLILIPYSMFSSSLMYQIVGVQESIILNSEGKYYDGHYVHDQESCGAKWLKEYNKDNTMIYSTDAYVGRLRLMSQGNIPKGLNDDWSFRSNRTCRGYIYLGYYNVVDGKLFGSWRESYNLSDYSHQFIGKNEIYANGGSEVYI